MMHRLEATMVLASILCGLLILAATIVLAIATSRIGTHH